MGSNNAATGGSVIDDLFGNADGSPMGNSESGPTLGGNGNISGGTTGGLSYSRSDLASLDATDNCFVPNRAQLAKLLGRHDYTALQFKGGATGVQVVKVPLCPAARARVLQSASANTNVGALRMELASSGVSNALVKAGFSPQDVIGIDHNKGKIIAYVL